MMELLEEHVDAETDSDDDDYTSDDEKNDERPRSKEEMEEDAKTEQDNEVSVKFRDIYFDPAQDAEEASERNQYTRQTRTDEIVDERTLQASKDRHGRGTAVARDEKLANSRILSAQLLMKPQSLQQATILKNFMMVTLGTNVLLPFQQIPYAMLSSLLAFTAVADMQDPAVQADLFEFFQDVRLLPSALSNLTGDFAIADQILLLQKLKQMIRSDVVMKIHMATDDSNRNSVDYRIMIITFWNPTLSHLPCGGAPDIFFLAIRKLVGTTADDLSFLDWDMLTTFTSCDSILTPSVLPSVSSSGLAAVVPAVVVVVVVVIVDLIIIRF